jgi:hypothetical protein
MIRLLVRFDYLRINHPIKRLIDLYIPGLVSALLVGIGWFNFDQVRMTGPDGVFDRFLSFVPTLIGFYIAALAAVATFNKPDMDEDMPGDPVFLNSIQESDSERNERLTRRRFLCLLFGYLCAVSLVIGILAFFGMFVGPEIAGSHYAAAIVQVSFISIFFYLVANMISTTFFGLYYLVDRMHRTPLEVKGLYLNSPKRGTGKN